MIGKNTVIGLALFAIVGLWVLPASADLLTTGIAYNDGITVWRGTSNLPVVPDPVLGAYVEWAVYAPGAFPFAGYTPTPGEFTYAYQLFSTRPAAISNFTVGLDNLADNIGTFVDGGNGVTGIQPLDPPHLYGPLPGGSASWDFDGITQDGHSCGLVFSSPYAPLENLAVIVNHGEFRTGLAPSPSNGVPEPATLWLLGSGLGLIVAGRWFRRR
jgi:hypothetical protein